MLFKNGVPKDWQKSADAIAQAGAMPRPEAAKACRRGCGWINVLLPEDKARAAAATLTSAGIEAAAVSKSEIVPPAVAQNIMNGFVEDNGFRYLKDPKSAPELLSWAAIRLIYAGYIIPGKRSGAEAALISALEMNKVNTQIKAEKIVDTALDVFSAMHVAGPARKIEKLNPKNMPPVAEPEQQKSGEVCVDLISTDPSVRLRLRQRRFNYQSLGARMQATQRANFRLLVNDVLAKLPNVKRLGHIDTLVRGGNLEAQDLACEEADLDMELSGVLTRERIFSGS